MSLALLSGAAVEMGDQLERSFPELFRTASITDAIAERLRQWQLTSAGILAAEFPFVSHEQQLMAWKERAGHETVSVEGLAVAVAQYLELCATAQLPDSESFWQKEVASLNVRDTQEAELMVSARLLETEWQKALDKAREEWELARITLLRTQFLEQLQGLLETLAQLHLSLEKLGLEPGVFFDLSDGALTAQEIARFQRWAKYLANDEGVQRLCDLLGRLRQLESSERVEHVRERFVRTVELPDINSREEITGIRLGRDIEYALPGELALLADPDTSVLFDLKYVESRLMCFEMQGVQQVEREFFKETLQSVEEDKAPGPMIICIDTSGSMAGMPETVAKAVVLFMAGKARQQKRACYVINFSTGIDVLDLGNAFGMEALLEFLAKSFHGGTDAAPALDHALKIMQSEAYERADLLIVSDFIMGGLSESLCHKIEQQRSCDNRFYSLVVGEVFMTERLESLFDQEWVYDPRTSGIRELVAFQQQIQVR